MRDKRRLSINQKGKVKTKHLSEPVYSDSTLSLHWHEGPPARVRVRCLHMNSCGGFFFFFCLCRCVSESTNPEQYLSTRWTSRAGSSVPRQWPAVKKQALGTPTTIGKALYWSSSFKMQHRIKGYMLVHVTHNKVSRIFTAIVLRRDFWVTKYA